MKNIILVFLSVCIALCVSEATLRMVARHRNFVGITMNFPPHIFENGTFLNPNSGTYHPISWNKKIQYHYLSQPIIELAKSKLQGDSLCAFCSRFKRGLLYACCRLECID